MLALPPMPAPNTVLLHIGPHKTGTTAIQKTLLDNTAALAAHAAVYPRIGFSYYGHHQLASLLERPDTELLTDMARQLNALHDQTVILSSENFSRASPEGLERLAILLSEFGEVRVIVYLRNFLEILYPWWQELVKHRLADDLNGFLVDCFVRPFRTHLLDAAGMLQRFASTFNGTVFVYYYDRVMQEYGDVSRHFMQDILGIGDYQQVTGVATLNKSLDPVAAEIVRCLNRSGEFGITVFERHPGMKHLHDSVVGKLRGYRKATTLSYNQFTPRQLEINLANSLRKLGHTTTAGTAGRNTIPEPLFEKREHEIWCLDPSIWLFEADLAALLRSILRDVADDRGAYARQQV